MSLDVCSGFLEALAILNDGVNHVSSYTVERLPGAVSLDSSLASYFASMETSNDPPQPADRWQIRTASIEGDWAAVLRHASHRWFFEQEFSPKTDPDVAEGVVREFLQHLHSVVGDARTFKVQVAPPMWYECAWEDFAFESQGGRWLLHFGFSD
jgi:hypothetical protein